MTSSKGKYKPTLRDIFHMPFIGKGQISPNGDKVIYSLGYFDDFQGNQIRVFAYLYDIETGKTHQLTSTNRVSQLRWVNKQTPAFLKLIDDSGFQIHVSEELTGDSRQVTDHPGGVETYEPFGNGFVYIATRLENPRAAREEQYGSFVNVEEEDSLSALFYIDRQRSLDLQWEKQHNHKEDIEFPKPIVELSRLLNRPLKINSIVTSPNNEAVFINCQSKEDGFFNHDTFCFRIQFDPIKIFDIAESNAPIGELTEIALPKGALIKAISPDGSKLLISYKDNGLRENIQTNLWLLDLNLTKKQLENPDLIKRLACITHGLDQEPLNVYWSNEGIFVSYWKESSREVARLSEQGKVEVWDIQGLSPDEFNLNKNGQMFLCATSPTSVPEIYIGSPEPKSKGWSLRKITQFGERFADWDFGSVESIKWTSKDGTEIEGVLRKPSDFDSSKKYPLIFYIHGGPAWASPFILIDNTDRYFYPTVQLLNKNILVFEPNYRGSMGKGQAFLSLNTDNLGEGDMWDIESAIDFLVGQGFVDEDRIGAMGWSQGGYISAFAAMHTTRFKAVSAGAALSDWRIYYGGSEFRYTLLLSGDPYKNKALYAKSAPISAIDKARTPILFQHGENDPVVPLFSAKEMYRALKARGVQTHLFVFSGQGHGVFQPRETYALMLQNYRWFTHHLLGEELDFYRDYASETTDS